MTESSRNESRGNRGNKSRAGGYSKQNGSSGGGRKFKGEQGDKKFSDRRGQGRPYKKDDSRNDRGGKFNKDRKFGERSENRFSDGKKREGGFRDDRRDNRRDDRRDDRRQDRGERNFEDRKNGGRRYNNENRPAGGHKRGGVKQREERFNRGPAQSTGAKDGYRPSKPVGPEFDTDVTGKELDGFVQRQLRALELQNAEVVAKNLVMVSRYLDLDPQFALEHAKAAVKRAGRIAAVREAAGIAAYVAEDYEMALRELRTHRRISGSNDHLALLIDSERALGRIPKALEMIAESKNEELDAATRVEIALVLSGIRHDQGDLQGAISALEIPELNPKRGYDYSPRLFEAYADLLDEAGRGKEAARWMRLAVITEAALGQGDFAEPEIFDIFGEAELLEPEEESVDLEGAEKVVEAGLSAEDEDHNQAKEAEASEEAEETVEAEEADQAPEPQAGDEDFIAEEEAPQVHEITEETSVDDDIVLETDVQAILNYNEDGVQEDLFSMMEEEKDA